MLTKTPGRAIRGAQPPLGDRPMEQPRKPDALTRQQDSGGAALARLRERALALEAANAGLEDRLLLVGMQLALVRRNNREDEADVLERERLAFARAA